MPNFLTQKILNQVGFSSSDNEAYKLISSLVDYTLEEQINSIKNIKALKKRR